jgi:hypothetical protein
MSEENSPNIQTNDKPKSDHKITDLYYSFNFELTKISDSKASTLIMISGQSILITAFLLANIIDQPNAAPIAIGFSLSVIFNVLAISLAIAALRPRTFKQGLFYTYITDHTKEEFISEFTKFQQLSKEENDKHYAELIYHISTILTKKMRYVLWGSIILFIGIGLLAISIFILVFQIIL